MTVAIILGVCVLLVGAYLAGWRDGLDERKRRNRERTAPWY